MKKPGKQAKRQMQKAVKGSPAWLATAIIGTRAGAQRKPIRGSFGAASAVVSIDPKTGLPRDAM
jgi:hypothetical protein